MNRAKITAATHCQDRALLLSQPSYLRAVQEYLKREFEQDVGHGDLTSWACGLTGKGETFILAKEKGILAGEQEVKFFVRQFPRIKITFHKHDGQALSFGQHVASLKGSISDLLTIERVLLNLLGRMSGVATWTKKFVDLAHRANHSVLLTPTRKTLLNLLDKRACFLGGGGTHRLGLDNAILIKHTHVRASRASASKLLHRVISKVMSKTSSKPSRKASKAKFLEFEVGTESEALEAASILASFKQNGFLLPFFVMFDNMTPHDISLAIKKIRKAGWYENVLFEASGRINEKNLATYATTGVDVISVGALTHSAPMLDMSMRVAT